jgi:PAS domain S-box-containing protein
LLAGKKTNIDLRIQLASAANENIWVRILAKNTFDFNNTIDGVFGTIENINNSYNDSLLLQDSNERINTILNNSKEIILTLNLDKNIIASVNDAVEILGYKPEEWINKSYKSWNNEQRQQFHELMRLAVQSELQVKNQQITFANKTNTERISFEFSTSIFYFKNSRYLLCVLRDIRERLKYEESISLISTQLTHLLNNIDDVYAIFNLKTGSYDFVSDNVENLYHCDKQSYLNNVRLWRECIHKDDVPGVEKEVYQIVANKSKGEIFYRIQTSTGERKILLEKLVVGKDNNGVADKLYIVKSDYTNIKNAEQSLMETERKFRFISENLSDFISIHDVDWNFTYASPSIKNILGFEPGEVLGMGGFDLVHPDDLLKTLNECVQPIVLHKKETQFRYRMLSKDNTFKWVETYAKPVIDAKGEILSIISSTRDVTDQVTSENKLRESEEQYRLLSENSNDIIGIHNLEKEFLYISPSCKQILGYSPSELLGKRPQDIYSSGDTSAPSVTEPNKVIEERKERTFLSTIKTKSGKEKVLEVWVKPLFKADVLIGLQSASRDVTEREKLLTELENSLAKERELNELREKFVSTASHQFRTPLTVIQSGVEIMDMYLEDLPEAKQAKFQHQFKKIQEEVSRLENLMNDVLVLGRANAMRTPFRPEKRSLVDFCSATIENKYNGSYLPERQILLSTTGIEVPVSFDEKLVSHSIENIISNAYKYSTGGNIYLDLIYEAKRVIINIKDHGAGIPEEDIKNLFQPFYRATNTSEIDGTGLGLSIVKEFIEIHGGEIFLTSKINKGTTVSVILPIV